MSTIIIYSPYKSNRLEYVLDFVFINILGTGYKLTTSESDFLTANLFRINYSHKDLKTDLHIGSTGLLFETEVVEKEIYFTKWNDLPDFFQKHESEIPFDIFSAIFYLLSRYEEYLPYMPDEYNRFPHSQSIAFQNDFLNIPLVDLWIEELKKIIYLKNNTIVFKENKFSFLPTYDIDIAYSFKGKGLVRNLGGAIRDILKLDINTFTKRVNVLFSNAEDPYDCFDFLDELHQQFRVEPIYFFLLSEGSELDKNIDRESLLMKNLITQTQSKYEIGIHPSWNSHESFDILKQEVLLLKNVSKSRQHYIRFTLPETFNNLIKLGIKDDYSMGYGSINGFRASTSHSFNWFDLEKNEVTNLTLHPFCYMECNSFYEQNYSSEQAFNEMLHYLNIVKKVNGNLITIWHNFSLGTELLWIGWKEKYVAFLEKC